MSPEGLETQVAVPGKPESIAARGLAVEASSWLEIGLTVISLIVVFFVVTRKASRIAILLLIGLAFLVLKHLLFLLIFWLQPQVLWPGAVAGYVGSLGWLFILLYCLGLLVARRVNKA